jgi:mono/diheme cytochrome c family protein
MRSLSTLACAAALGACAAGCSGVKSPAGFSLPDGDVEAGRRAFVDLGCARCHEVSGLELPGRPSGLPEPVVLGGEVLYTRTDGELVTAIIDPSHALARGYPREAIESGGKSRMKDYSDILTARQLIDLVAFLHSRYKTVPPPVARS